MCVSVCAHLVSSGCVCVLVFVAWSQSTLSGCPLACAGRLSPSSGVPWLLTLLIMTVIRARERGREKRRGKHLSEHCLNCLPVPQIERSDEARGEEQRAPASECWAVSMLLEWPRKVDAAELHHHYGPPLAY